MRIPGLRGLTVRELAKRTISEFLADDLLTYAAALSYHLFFALFPFLIFLLALLSFLDLSSLFDPLLEQARRALPQEAYQQVYDVIQEVQGQGQGGLLSFGILASVWFASIGIRSTMNALNRAYDIEEGRSRVERYGLSILYTVGFAVLVVVATFLMVVGPQMAAWLAGRIGVAEVEAVISWLRIPFALVLAAAAISLIYYFAPNLNQRYRLITPGSIFAVLAWALASIGFQFYVSSFGRYSVTYGSVGAVIVLLLYFFLSSVVMLLGGEINAIIEKHAPRHGELEKGPGA